MIQDSTQIRESFFNCLNSLSETPWLFTNQAGDCKCQYKNVGKVENKNVGFSPYSSVA